MSCTEWGSVKIGFVCRCCLFAEVVLFFVWYCRELVTGQSEVCKTQLFIRSAMQESNHHFLIIVGFAETFDFDGHALPLPIELFTIRVWTQL